MLQSANDLVSVTANFFEEVLTKQNYAVIPTVLAPNYAYTGRPQTVAGLTGWINSLHAKFPGLQFVMETIFSDGVSVALRWQMQIPASQPVGLPPQPAGSVTGTNILVYVGGLCISNDQNDLVNSGTFVPTPT